MGLAPTGAGGTSAPGGFDPGRIAGKDPTGKYYVDTQGNIIGTVADIDAQAARFAADPNQGGSGQSTVFGSQMAGDLLTKDNPVAGTFRAGDDLVQGHPLDAASDFAAGTSYGTLPKIGPDGQIQPGDTVSNVVPGVNPNSIQVAGKAIGGATDAAGNLVQGIGDLVSPATSDPSGLSRITDKALSTQDALTSRYQNLEANPTKAPQSDLVQLDQTNIDPLRARQTGALDLLTDAATGRVPSAAEILGREQANRAAAQAYGTAAALQGGQSSGGALRQALDAQTQLQGDANTQLMAARAKEMEAARGQLVQGIGNARGQESADATTNANLDQNKNLANTQAAVTTHGQDVSEKGDLISGQNTALGIGEQSEKAKVDAETANAQSANALKGAVIGGAAGVVGHLIDPKSDRRSKTDVRSVDLVQLADDLPGYTFDYKDAQDGPGRRVGVMAQDAAKARMGRDLVRLGDDGDLVLDGANSLGAALAMSAEALRKAEAARKRR